jgi:lipopolysaccharide export system permease protein
MFIFVLQTIWLFINDLAGKGLDIFIVLKFLLYFSPKLVPLVLPLTILLASIMTFGNFAENYEFAAMKSSGISLQRAMGSLIILISLIGIGAFYFSNNVIPYAELKSLNLRKNLAKVKPALAIEEGVFNDIGEQINIKVDDKYGDNDQNLNSVTIHEKTADRQNRVVIKAKEGELKSSEKSDILQLVLYEGNRYEDVNPTKRKERERMPHAKLYFEEYTMNIDISEFNDVDLEEEGIQDHYRMLSVSQLIRKKDTLTTDFKENVLLFGENLYKRSGILSFTELKKPVKKVITDSLNNEVPVLVPEVALVGKLPNLDSVLQAMKDYKRAMVLDQAITNSKNALATVKSKEPDFFRQDKLINMHILEIHNKFALAVSCIILFFVGAPLGAIIRKGGMGLPMVVAIAVFLIYHFIGVFGNKSAEDGTIMPLIGAWLSTIVMLPLSIILTRKATADQGLFNPDSIVMPVKEFFEKLAGIRHKKQ